MVSIATCMLRPLLESLVFRVTLVACLIFALFGGGLFVVIDVPDDPGILVLDTMMTAVTILFVAEMVINGIVDYKTYPLSLSCSAARWNAAASAARPMLF